MYMSIFVHTCGVIADFAPGRSGQASGKEAGDKHGAWLNSCILS
jgi:hypothetical protein